VLIAAKDHPLSRKKKVTIREIASYPLILPPRHLATWRVVDFAFHKHKLKYHVKLEAGGWEVIKKYVELGLGISIVASICLTGKEALTMIPVTRYFPKRRYGVVTRRGKFMSPQAQRFLEIMTKAASKRGPLGSIGTAGKEH
jgi:DNA-binding transcriptional LysR family regulator